MIFQPIPIAAGVPGVQEKQETSIAIINPERETPDPANREADKKTIHCGKSTRWA